MYMNNLLHIYVSFSSLFLYSLKLLIYAFNSIKPLFEFNILKIDLIGNIQNKMNVAIAFCTN